MNVEELSNIEFDLESSGARSVRGMIGISSAKLGEAFFVPIVPLVLRRKLAEKLGKNEIDWLDSSNEEEE